ncbi:TetR/AcrR family transcriptional regulator [Nocardioides limicola]|uniref:TetR/AcrR family transcriptional regulator n=1 Tax=Nocardioides limicola TaxID=2803368 RepID=UPI00193B094E|nr:TetR family transcriptional regulator [Nocardioides sp. DJM-14]
MSTASVRGPGRPREFDHGEALDALLMLFWSHGYEATTQEQMLSATGLSSSSLFRTFGTKVKTYEAALARYMELADALLAPLEADGDVVAFIDRLSDQLVGTDRRPGCPVVTAIQSPINATPQIAALTTRHLARMRQAIADDALYAGVLGVLALARAGDEESTNQLLDALRRAAVPR